MRELLFVVGNHAKETILHTLLRASLAITLFLADIAFAHPEPHNVILFVADGLRGGLVSSETAPTMAQLRDQGVYFRNSHALFPTLTMPNAAAFATGHVVGDTGLFSNAIYTGLALRSVYGSVVPFLESDQVLTELATRYGAAFFGPPTVMATARATGYATAAIGKGGPIAIQDPTALDGAGTLLIDDFTGLVGGVPLPVAWRERFQLAQVPTPPPTRGGGRGENGNPGNYVHRGTIMTNAVQQQYFLDVTVNVVLEELARSGKPFVLVYWSRDPDGTQHNQGDSFKTLTPGINGPTSLAAVHNADLALATIEQELRLLNLLDMTDIIVASTHGFSTIAKNGIPSESSSSKYADVGAGDLPVGFLAIDLSAALGKADPRLKLFDPDDSYQEINWKTGRHPVRGNAIIGVDADHPRVVVAANGGSDLIYLPGEPIRVATPSKTAEAEIRAPAEQRSLAKQIVEMLLEQQYVSGVFVDRARFGNIPGTLATEDIGLVGAAVAPHPDIVVSFASFVIRECAQAESTLCAAEIADTLLQQGQGMHGSFSRADTWNFIAARGPDFRSRFVDPLPASNADIGCTIAALLSLSIQSGGPLMGRVLTEAFSSTPTTASLPVVTLATRQSAPDPRNHLRTLLKTQTVNGQVYFDAGGFSGRTVGLDR